MGSPVSPIVANLCMEEIEELAHNQSTLPPKKWFRFVDDIFSIIKRHMLTNCYSYATIYLILLTHILSSLWSRN